MPDHPPSIDVAAALYLDLLKQCLTRNIFEGPALVPLSKLKIASPIDALSHPQLIGWMQTGRAEVLLRAGAKGVEPQIRGVFDADLRREGRDWPADAESMIGLRRMDNIQHCVIDVLARNIPGDLVETGVWRGGATILMRGILKALGDSHRVVWACDSFEGLPPPNATDYPADRDYDFSSIHELAVSIDQVKANFARYGLLDDQVQFLKGWFKDTLPTAPIEKIAVLRLDGDMYESTMDALRSLYPKVSEGGYVIIDDYGDIPACQAAVDDYRTEHGITDPIQRVDWTGVYWQRSA